MPLVKHIIANLMYLCEESGCFLILRVPAGSEFQGSTCSRLKPDLSDSELDLLGMLDCRSGRPLLDQVGAPGCCGLVNESCTYYGLNEWGLILLEKFKTSMVFQMV
jgi:hypothetical protein